jgi:hypothetical protein
MYTLDNSVAANVSLEARYARAQNSGNPTMQLLLHIRSAICVNIALSSI